MSVSNDDRRKRMLIVHDLKGDVRSVERRIRPASSRKEGEEEACAASVKKN